MYCTKCGKFVEREDALFCPFCGAELKREGTQSFQQQGVNMGNHPYSYQYHNPYDAPSLGWGLVSFLIPMAGLILYLVWKNESPLKAKSCLQGFIASIVLEVICILCFCSLLGQSSYYMIGLMI